MSNRLAWGILATGSIAGTFAKGVAKSQHSRLAAVGSRTQASAARFAAEFGVPVAHGSYAALLADPAVQAVYLPRCTRNTVSGQSAQRKRASTSCARNRLA